MATAREDRFVENEKLDASPTKVCANESRAASNQINRSLSDVFDLGNRVTRQDREEHGIGADLFVL
jgi:hypothetical protein